MLPLEDTEEIHMVIEMTIVTEELPQRKDLAGTCVEPSTGAERAAGSDEMGDTKVKDPVAATGIIHTETTMVEGVVTIEKNDLAALPELVPHPLRHQLHRKSKLQGRHRLQHPLHRSWLPRI